MKKIKIILFCIVAFLFTMGSYAQRINMNMPEHDNKAYYFGLSFGLNFSEFKIQYTKAFTTTDTFYNITARWGPGFNLGLMGNLRLSNRFDLRMLPSLSLTEKRLRFNAPLKDTIIDKTVESIYFHLPLQLKFKSDRIKNFRFYALTGGKIDYDMASNARSRKANEFLKVKPFDAGYEFGMGFEFYFSNFIFSPEIKVSQGLLDQIYRDKNLPLTNAIERINARSIVISIHLEG